MTHLEYINKFALISNPIIYLRNYLTLSDAAKGEELAHYVPWAFIKWYAEDYFLYLDPEDSWADVTAEDELKNRLETAIEYDGKFPDIPEAAYEEFYEHATNDPGLQEVLSYPEAPTFLFMDFEKVMRNDWLIHFTDDAYSIAAEGFTRGSGRFEELGLTTHLPESVKEYGGYNFAYDIHDYERYGRGSMWGGSRGIWKYGSEAVVFRASGVKVHHFGDNEPQVIFWGESANSIVPIQQYSETGEWYVGEVGDYGRAVYESEKLDDVVWWVITNYEQYRRVL